jgi:hypothetical protein
MGKFGLKLNGQRSPWATLLRVAWLAIVLGLLLQLALLLVAVGFGASSGLGALLAETCRTVCWSLLVCVGVALGRIAAKGVLLEGVTGLLAAPLALTAANTLQKGVAEALSVAGATVGPAPLWVLAIKAAEYACLGRGARVDRSAWPGKRTRAHGGRAGDRSRLRRRVPDDHHPVLPNPADPSVAARTRRQRAAVSHRMRTRRLHRRGPRQACNPAPADDRSPRGTFATARRCGAGKAAIPLGGGCGPAPALEKPPEHQPVIGRWSSGAESAADRQAGGSGVLVLFGAYTAGVIVWLAFGIPDGTGSSQLKADWTRLRCPRPDHAASMQLLRICCAGRGGQCPRVYKQSLTCGGAEGLEPLTPCRPSQSQQQIGPHGASPDPTSHRAGWVIKTLAVLLCVGSYGAVADTC